MTIKSKHIAVGAAVLAVISFVAFVCTWLMFMHTETVDPGYHGVIIDKPYFGGHQGVRDEPLKEGRILLFRTSSVEDVRMTPQSHVVKVDDYSSKDNILLDFETTIQFRITDAVKLVDKFGAGWFDNNIKNQYLAIVREAVKRKTMTEMMSDVSAAQQIDDEVTKGLQALVTSSNLPIEVLNVSMGRAKPNENVLAQMNETAAQQQRKKTLIEAEAAELQRKSEQTAKAAADNAYRNAMGLSPEMFIQLESIKRYSDACAKSAHCIVTSGQTNIQVPVK
jgi:regulator of protease activity HflC (stomatin/prohibitin superfamily)